jgi:aryl-alcohol dehydrogenase-like predicted oxidoreductase
MRMKKLGATGLVVSEICLGTMTFSTGEGFWGPIGNTDQASATGIVKSAFEHGVNFIDTADVYSAGIAETMTGQALKSLALPRDQFVLATKVLGRMGPGANQSGLSRAHILHSVDASLKRLQLDYIDLYQTHGRDPLTPLEETLDALDACVRAGKVRYIGLCNLPAWEIAKALGISARRARSPASRACRPTTRSPVVIWSARSCRSPRMSIWLSCRGARSPVASCPANSRATAQGRQARAA